MERPLRAVWSAAERYWEQMTKPDRDSLLVGGLADMTRSRKELIAENAFLRQQVIVLKRQQAHPRLTWRDRALMVLLASKVWGWNDALLVVKLFLII